MKSLVASLRLRVLVSGLVSALFTSALVLAQVPKPAAPPGGTTIEQKVEKVKTRNVKQAPDQKAGPRGAVGPAPAPKPAIRAVNQVRVRAMAGAANRDNLIQQWTTQGRPMVRAELIFVRNICKLDRDQFRQINRDAGEVLKDVVTKMVDGQLQPRAIVRAVPPAGGRPQPARPAQANPDGGKLLQDGLAALMKKDLSPEQWSRYQAELDKRLAGRKEAAVRFLLDSLDRDLYLSDQQRARLTESLSAQWDDGWNIYLDYVLFGNQFFPMGIDPLVSPVLTDTQKKVWQGFQRVGGFWGFGGMGGGFTNDGDALEAELGEAKPRNPALERRIMMAPPIVEQEVELHQLIERRRAIEVRKAEMKKVKGKQAETKKAGVE